MKKNISTSIILVCIVILGALIFSPQIKNPSEEKNTPVVEQNQIRKVNLSFDFGGEKKSFEIPTNGKENLFDLVLGTNLEIKTEEFPPFGVMITGINGFKNGDDSKYWQYLINGKYAEVGASAYIPQPNDQIEWKFTDDVPK